MKRTNNIFRVIYNRGLLEGIARTNRNKYCNSFILPVRGGIKCKNSVVLSKYNRRFASRNKNKIVICIYHNFFGVPRSQNGRRHQLISVIIVSELRRSVGKQQQWL